MIGTIPDLAFSTDPTTFRAMMTQVTYAKGQDSANGE